jgi:hypothetical protein
MKIPDYISDFNMLLFKLNLARPVESIATFKKEKSFKPTSKIILLNKKDNDLMLSIPGVFKYSKAIIKFDENTVKLDYHQLVTNPLKDLVINIVELFGKYGSISHIHFYETKKKPTSFCLISFKKSKSCQKLLTSCPNIYLSKYNFKFEYQKEFDNIIVYDYRLQVSNEVSDKVWIFGQHSFPDLHLICEQTYFNNRTILFFNKIDDAVVWQKYFCSQKNLICGFVNCVLKKSDDLQEECDVM